MLARLFTHVFASNSTGIGMTIESDFYATDVGRQHFRDQLTSIRFCVRSATARSD